MSRRALSRYTLVDRLLTLWDWFRSLNRTTEKQRTRLGFEAMEERIVPTASVWLDPASLNLPEGGSTIVRLLRSGDNGDALTVNLGIGQDGQGDAQATWNTDYTLTGPSGTTALSSTGGTVTFGISATEVDLTLTALETGSTGIEGLRLTVLTGTGYLPGNAALSSGGGATSDFQINGTVPVVWLSPNSQGIGEGTQGGVWVYRGGGNIAQPLTVNLQFGQDGGGDALAVWNTDYTVTGPSSGGSSAALSSTGGTVTFGSGQTAVYLTVAALSDPALVGVEGFRVTVQPSANYQAGWSSSSSTSGGSGSSGSTSGSSGSEATSDVLITVLPSLSIAADPSPVVTDQSVTFSVLSGTGTVPDYTSVEWDFNYNGQTFNPSVFGTDLEATTWFSTTGPRTIAVQLTDDLGIVQLVTLDVTVGTASFDPGTLSIQPDTSTPATGSPVTFSLTSATGSVPAFTSVAWDFNYDWNTFQANASGVAPSATTTFDTAGTRTVAAQLTDAQGNTQILTFDVVVTDPAPPVQNLSITAGSDPIVVGQNVTFTIGAETGSVPAFTSVAWDFNYDWNAFNPSVSGTATSVSTTFGSGGEQTVAAQVTDASGNTQIITFDVSVQDAPPAPSLSIAADSDSVFTGRTVTFTLGNDNGALPTYTSIAWDFNYDGQTFRPSVTGAATSVTTSFNTSGGYVVAAQVTDASGNTQIVTTNESVSDAPTGQLSITASADTIVVGDPVTFSLASATGDPVAYTSVAWDFNYDGQTFQPSVTSTVAAISTTFSTPGTQTVAAQVTDAAGNVQTITLDITIEGGTPLDAVGPLSIVANNDNGTDLTTIHTGDSVTFTVTDAEGNVPPAFTSVAWDFNYDGRTFNPSVTGTGLSADATFNTPGTQTVAALVTDDAGGTTIVTAQVTIAYPPPTVTLPADMTVAVGTPVVLDVVASDPSGIASVSWQFSYDGQDYQTDPTLTTLTPTYTFPTYGQYSVLVTVTANDGQTTEDSFTVTATEVTPTAGLTVSGPINEGQAETFTLNTISPDTLDTVSILADWRGTGTFKQLNPEDLTVNANGTVSFTHVYDNNSAPQNVYPVEIRVEDDGGQFTDYTADVVVNDVAPQATLTAGTQFATMDTSGENVWVISPGQTLTFTNIQGPSALDVAQFLYHYKITDTLTGQITQPDPTSNSSLSLPSYDSGHIYTVEGWVSDRAGLESPSPHQSFTVVVQTNDLSDEGVITSPAYATAYIQQDRAPARYNRFAARPAITHDNWTEDTPLTIQVDPDPATVAFAQKLQATIVYTYTVSVYDVERFSIAADNDILLSSQPYVTNANSLQIGGWPKDRAVQVFVTLDLMRNGQDIGPSNRVGAIYVSTPQTPTTWQKTVSTVNGLMSMLQQFGDKAQSIFNAIMSNPEKFLNTLRAGVTGALSQFIDELPTTLKTGLLQWLLGSADLSAFSKFSASQLSDPEVITSVLLQYAGLTWDHVYLVVQQQLGAGNVAAIEKVFEWFGGANPIDPSDAKSMFALMQNLSNQVKGISLQDIQNQLQTKIEQKVVTAVGGAIVQIAAKFVPGAGAIQSIVNGLGWLVSNSQQLGGVVNAFLDSFQALADGDAKGFQKEILTAMTSPATVSTVISLVASQFGLGRLPEDLKKAVSLIPNQVDKELRAAVSKIASSVTNTVGGGTSGGLFDGKLAPERVFTYQKQSYVLWVAQEKGQTKVKVALNTGSGYQLIGALTAQSFDTTISPNAGSDLGALVSASQALYQATKPNPKQKADKSTLPNLRQLQQALVAAQNAVVQDILASACKALNAGCFAAGTKLLTRSGWTPVEEIGAGEEVASRSELDPSGAVEWKPVEATFRRTGRILHLHFPDGELIRTTPEHPFFVRGEGWTPAGSLKEGDRIATLSGEWVAVAEVFDTGEWETVYNLRVADFHTYFVGEERWGFAAWAHNSYYDQWVGDAFVLWKQDVNVQTALKGVSDTDAQKIFRAWCDTFDALLKVNQQTPYFAFLKDWKEIGGNAFSFEFVYKAFRKLYVPFGRIARLKDNQMPPPLDQQEQLKVALEVICTYKSKNDGDPRLGPNGVTIVGAPQDSDTQHLHQATVALLAAQWVIDPNTQQAVKPTVYMNRSITEVLQNLGVNITSPWQKGVDGSKPDVIRVRTDGKIDVFEVQSTKQPKSDVDTRVANIISFLRANCPNLIGDVQAWGPPWGQPLNSPADLFGVQLPK
jgi:hypothetical protein